MSGEASTTISPDRIRAQSLLDDDRTRQVGSCLVQKKGNSKYAVLPQPFADMLGVEANQEIDLYVNLELGLVIHKLTEEKTNGQK